MKRLVVLSCLLMTIVFLFGTLPAHGQSLEYIADVVWSDDGSTLLVATTDTIYLYDARDWEALPEILPLETAWIRTIDTLGDLVVIGSEREIGIFNFRTGERVFKDETLPGFGYAAFRTEDEIVRGTFNVSRIDISSGERLQAFGEFFWPVSAFAVSPDGKYVAATNLGEGGFLWEIETGETAMSLPDTTDIAFSLDGTALAYTRFAGDLIMFDIVSDKIRWQNIPYEYGAISLAFHPDGKAVAAGYRDGTLIICDAETGDLIDQIQAYQPPGSNEIINYGLAYSPDGTLLASGGRDMAVRIWDVSAGHFADEPIVVLAPEKP